MSARIDSPESGSRRLLYPVIQQVSAEEPLDSTVPSIYPTLPAEFIPNAHPSTENSDTVNFLPPPSPEFPVELPVELIAPTTAYPVREVTPKLPDSIQRPLIEAALSHVDLGTTGFTYDPTLPNAALNKGQNSLPNAAVNKEQNYKEAHRRAYEYNNHLIIVKDYIIVQTKGQAILKKINLFNAYISNLHSDKDFKKYGLTKVEKTLREYFLNHLIDEYVRSLSENPNNFVDIDLFINDSLIPFAFINESSSIPFVTQRTQINIFPTPFVPLAIPNSKRDEPVQTPVPLRAQIHFQILSRYCESTSPDLDYFANLIKRHWSQNEQFVDILKYHPHGMQESQISAFGGMNAIEIFFTKALEISSPEEFRRILMTHFGDLNQAVKSLAGFISFSTYLMQQQIVTGSLTDLKIEQFNFESLKNRFKLLSRYIRPDDLAALLPIGFTEKYTFNPAKYAPSTEERATILRLSHESQWNKQIMYLVYNQLLRLNTGSSFSNQNFIEFAKGLGLDACGRLLGKVYDLGDDPRKECDPKWAEHNFTRELGERALRAIVEEDVARLPETQRNEFHGMIYEGSTDPTKGGDKWGETHCFDDILLFFRVFHTTNRN